MNNFTSKVRKLPLSSGLSSREDKGQSPALEGLLVSWVGLGQGCLESLDLGTKGRSKPIFSFSAVHHMLSGMF